MGGTVRGIASTIIPAAVRMGNKALGQASAPAPQAAKPVGQVGRADEEQGARMRGARRRGRQLLSDARLNPAANETLGANNGMGS